jgi:hypothetical protein
MSVDAETKEKVIAFDPARTDDHLPEAVRREMARMAREREGKPGPPPGVDAPAPADTVPPLDEISHFPLPGDPYEAYSRPDGGPQHKLCLLFKGVGFLLLDYGNFDSAEYEAAAEPGGSPALVLLFAGLKPIEVRLTGRHLRPLGSYLRQHRIAWLREHPTGTTPGSGTAMVIAAIAVKPLKV